MQKYYAKAHTSFLGESGYNQHEKNIFTELNKLIEVKVRNFTMDGSNLFSGPDGGKSVNTGEKNGMYGKCGILNNSATKYIIKTPDGSIIEIIGREAVAKYLNCSYGVFTSKKCNGYKIVDKIKINKK